MMLKIALLLLSLSSVANCAEEFKLAAKQGKRCVGVAGGRTAEFKLGKENQKLSVCKAKCENDPECTAMQYISPKQCSLWYDIVSVSDSANASISNSLVPFSFVLCHYFISFVTIDGGCR